LSGKDRGKPDRARTSDSPKGPASPEKKARKQRPADVGRALRTVYDDTLRESVPNEFLDLLGKLS
jgi:Anti-sigma factor NepR